MKLVTMTLATLVLAWLAPAAVAQSGPDNVVFTPTNLSAFGADDISVYEAWARVGGQLISLGTFDINAVGLPVDVATNEVITEFDAGQDVSQATEILVSVEPRQDSFPEPSGVFILRGDVDNGQADLQVDIPDRLQLTAEATASYVLATPSDGDDPGNAQQGIWYTLQPGPQAGLQHLPAIGPDWQYEGWIVDITDPLNPEYYSTGTFTSGTGYDSDQAGPMGGGPAFPGQDFTAYQGGEVLDLNSGAYAAMITVEPMTDTSNRPFPLTVFRGGIPTDALDQENTLENRGAVLPSATAAVYSEVSVEAAALGEVKVLFR
jgi:hypothetical protein